jgi:hypothetical protein
MIAVLKLNQKQHYVENMQQEFQNFIKNCYTGTSTTQERKAQEENHSPT